jgi:hypothetical protein
MGGGVLVPFHAEWPVLNLWVAHFDSIRAAQLGVNSCSETPLIPSLACQREPMIIDKERTPPIAARHRPATLT